eukprot:TRINITY_DN24161_c0_g1_i1.p1 TRINITY_DN24161_c0_g1~~TRINITY_DN24161_c0_g1_i1.p1  ORF type:complete len:105 (-),score=12.70 TRINITY_DN24161_c0_g1_i1:4-318(-)
MSGAGVSYSKMAPSKFPKPDLTPRRIIVLDNENIHPPKEFLLNHTVRTFDQLKTKISEGIPIKPLKALYSGEGKMISSLDDLVDGQVVAAVKHAGRPFDKNLFK